MEEQWAAIDGYPNYAVSNLGNVANINRGEMLQPRPNDEGYLRVSLSNLGQVKDFYVHRLVAAAFLRGYDSRYQIKPVNGDLNDCRVENLYIHRQARFNMAPRRIRVTSQKVQVVETGMVFRTARDCADYIGGDYGSIYACLRGERRSHMGLTFVNYSNDYGEEAA